jgi:cytochrome c
MRRAELFATLPLLLAAALWACNKPAETTPPDDGSATAEPGTGEPATEDAEPADAPDPAAEQKAAEEKAAAEAAEKKTQADAQIAQGKDLYGANCASCHGANGEGKGKAPKVVGEGALPMDPPKGAKLRKGVKFMTAKDVADFVVAKMPLKKPGSLKPEEYLAILAFDLSANGVAVAEPVTMDNLANIVLHKPEEAAAAAPADAAAPAKTK